MPMIPDAEFARVYNDPHNSLEDVAEALGLTQKRVRNRAGEMRRSPEWAGRMISRRRIKSGIEQAPPEPVFESTSLPDAIVHSRPETGFKTFILTSAQDGSQIHEPFWRNLLAYADWLEAQVGQIKEMGYERYLSQQIREEK